MDQQPLGIFGLFWYLCNHWSDIQNQWSAIVQAVITLLGLVVGLASMITPLTKTPKDDALLAGLINWMHQLSVTNAKNVTGVGQDDTTKPPTS